ncbi:innexin inx2-like [Macrobrachium nipponense]|uniref:innexin inx2-like n=1 Tax=Macrobrachium nipponense TaxID=159736 RepID=UPI0030C7E7C4
MVLGVLGALAAIAKVRYSFTAVDSHVFRLHYRWTATFCFACCALVVAKEYVGETIECMTSDVNALKPITTYCWITSTFTINSTYPMRGVGRYDPKIHEQRFHAYYQWVPLVLFFQGCLFYMPHLIWKLYEGKHVDRLLQDLNKNIFDEDAKKKKENIISYVRESWGLNMQYAAIYHACEALNLANVLLQMYSVDRFLGGVFWDYGTKILSLVTADDAERYDALITVFPRLTKCNYRKIGPSGTVMLEDILCVLPQNIVNEKIYLVMWLWFIVLAIITAIWLIWRLAVLISGSLRLRLLERLSKSRLTEKMERTIHSLHLGDFCLLENIGHNVDALNFKDILQGVTDAVEEYDPSAPISDGTYTPFLKPGGDDLAPRFRHNAGDGL